MLLIKKSAAHGEISAPPSKSMAHRAIICAALAEGKSTVYNVDFSKDIQATVNCIRSLGAQVSGKNGFLEISCDAKTRGESFDNLFDCCESGSTLRFFIPLALMLNKKCVFTGSETLFTRPLDIYEKICRDNNFLFEKNQNTLAVCGRLRGGKYEISGSISSQFISGLMLALPLAENDSEITVIPPFESKPYVYMTQSVLKSFGIKTEINGNIIKINGSQKYIPQKYTVEGDYSNAAFFDALNVLGGSVNVMGLSETSLQGDRVYRDFYTRLGTNPTFDITNCPDLAPVLTALGAYTGGCTLTGTKRLKIKESDRGAVMAQELAKLGIKTDLRENSLTVSGSLSKPQKPLLSHNDHRVAMALALLLTKTGGYLSGEGAVSKSLPDFFDRLTNLGIEVEQCGL